MPRAAGSARPGHEPLLRSPVGFLLIPQFAVIALASAIEPLRIANRYLERPYEWKLLSLDGGPVTDDNGIAIRPHASIEDAGLLGTLVICADIRPERFWSRPLRNWLWQLERAGSTLGALDTGCFLLARAGLLEGCRVTLHWEVLDAFRERFPGIAVAQTLYEVDRRRLTCAGGTAAIDMMLSAIAIDHGVALANRIAEHCLHGGVRDAGAQQRMAVTLRERIHNPRLARAVQHLEATLERAVSLDELAACAQLSRRQLERLFAAQLGEGPVAYHRRLRLERARTLLRSAAMSVTDAAVATGFESLSYFSRAYRRAYGVTPGSERSPRARPLPLLRDGQPPAA